VLPQDQLADATKSLTNQINAKLAHQVNWLMLPTQDVLPNQTLVLETTFVETN
jgi:hypothetical protein